MSSMGYHTADLESIEPREGIPGSHHYVNDVVDLEHLTVQLVHAEPGEDFAPYHRHEVEEEVFVVIAGTLVVETPDGTYDVSEGEAFVAEPGSPLHPHNPADADSPVRAILVNAPVADDFRMMDQDE